jgi:hypothetical protein
MKIDEIVLGGSKRRRHRDPRKYRIVQQDLYTVKGSDLKEAKGREINHIEDLLLFHGVQGGRKALAALKNLEHAPGETTIKWDGSPAVIFGRNEEGEFVLTDKSGFSAKTYNGRVTSPEDLKNMFMNRKMKVDTPEKRQERQAFAQSMADIWSSFEAATPEDFRGYIAGDLMYRNTPPAKDGKLVFTPNTTTYAVDADSDIGKKIGNSKVGVVVHVQIDLNGSKSKPNTTNFVAGDLLILPPVSPSVPKGATGHDKAIADIENSMDTGIDKLINPPAELKMKDFDTQLYNYVNATVKTKDTPSPGGFVEWTQNNEKISGIKKQRMLQWVSDNQSAFENMWQVFNAISRLKDEIVTHLDNQDAEIEAYTGGQRGGEGYVVGKDMKLVKRSGFTAANFSRER